MPSTGTRPSSSRTRRDLVDERLRVAGAVREQHAVEAGERVGVDVVREDRDGGAGAGEPAQDRALGAVVDDRDARRALVAVDVRLRWSRRGRRARRRSSTAARGRRRAPRRRLAVPVTTAPRIAPRSRRCSASERVSIPVSAGMPLVRSQSVHSGPRASRITTARACGRADSERAVGDAVVADHRRGEADDLAAEARVGDDLLVAGHRGREDRLAETRARARRRSRRGTPSRPRAARKPRPSCLERDPAGRDRQRSPCPCSRSPSSHELAERERKRSSRTRQVAACSAGRGSPARRRRSAAGRGRRCAPGPADIRSSSVSSVDEARLDEVRVERANAVSRPVTPNGAASNGHVLLLARVRRVVGRDRRDRAVAQRVDQRRAVVARAQRRVHLQVRVERAHRLVGEAEVMRRHLAARRDAGRLRARAAARPTRAPRGASGAAAGAVSPASESSRATPRLSPSDGQPPRPSSAETAPMCMWPPRVSVGSSQCSASRRPVIALYSSARRIRPARRDRAAVVGERGGARVGELAHLGQLRALLADRDRGHEADRDLRLVARRGPAGRAGRRSSRRPAIGVRHREDRAVAAGGRGGRAGGDRLLVLAARRAQVHVRVDEGRREHEPVAVDHAVAVRVERVAELRRSCRRRCGRRGRRRRPRSGRARARRG